MAPATRDQPAKRKGTSKEHASKKLAQELPEQDSEAQPAPNGTGSGEAGSDQGETCSLGFVRGFELESVVVQNIGDKRLDCTTWEVDYEQIARGQACPWFMDKVAELEQDDLDYPHSSHGFSAVLTNVHRAKPKLHFSWEVEGPTYVWYPIKSYESAGVWMDSGSVPCLVILAKYDDGDGDEEEEMHLLYEAERRETRNGKLTKSCQWHVAGVGEGGHLVREGGTINCSRQPKAPHVSKASMH